MCTALDAAPARARTGDVVEQVAQQLQRRIGLEGVLAFVHQTLELALALAHQALDRRALFQPTLEQGLEHGTDHPPQLEQRRHARCIVEVVGDDAHRRQIALGVLAAQPAQQRGLEVRAQPPCAT